MVNKWAIKKKMQYLLPWLKALGKVLEDLLPSNNTLESGFGFCILCLYLLAYLFGERIQFFTTYGFTISLTKHLAKGDFRKGVSAVNSKEHNNDKILLCVSKWLDISRSQVRKVWWLLREIVLGIPQGLACYAFHRSITEIVLIRCSNYYPPKTVVLMGWEEASLSFAAYLLSLGHLLHYPPQEQRYLSLSLFFHFA